MILSLLTAGLLLGSVGEPQPPLATPAPLSLEEAVALAIQHDPKIQIARLEARSELGRLRETSGTFDPALAASASYDYETTALTQGDIDREAGNREILRVISNQLQAIADALRRQLDDSRDLIYPSCVSETYSFSIDTLGFDFDFSCQARDYQARQQRSLDLARFYGDESIEAMLRETNEQLTRDLVAILDSVSYRMRLGLRRLGTIPDFSDKKTLQVDLGFSKAYRNGIVVKPGVMLRSRQDTYRGKPHDSKYGGKGILDAFRSIPKVNVDVPLRKGRGRASTGAAEEAADAASDAALRALGHAMSESILRTSLAYWKLVAAQERLAFRERAMEISTESLRVGEQLLSADQIAARDLANLRGRLLEDDGRVRRARREVMEARIALAATIGLRLEKAEDAPRASDSWPPPPDSLIVRGLRETPPFQMALARRADLAAAASRRNSARILAKAARLNQRRRADLSIEVSYRGLHEGGTMSDAASLLRGYRKALFDYSPGPSVKATLTVDFPVRNDVARGQYVQARSLERQSSIQMRDLERTIRSRVLELTGALDRLTKELSAREAAVTSHQSLLYAEIERFKIGESDISAVIRTEEQELAAEEALIQSQLGLASLIAEMRHELGALVAYRLRDGDVEVERLRPHGYALE